MGSVVASDLLRANAGIETCNWRMDVGGENGLKAWYQNWAGKEGLAQTRIDYDKEISCESDPICPDPWWNLEKPMEKDYAKVWVESAERQAELLEKILSDP